MSTVSKYTNIETVANDLIYGDDVTIGDGRILRLTIVDDDWDTSSMFDEDCFGRLQWIDTRVSRYNRSRPDWCDGSARIIHVMGNGGSYWWQPPSDIKSDVDAIRKMAKCLVDVLEYGLQIVTVEICRNEVDYYGNPIVDDAMSIGGVGWHVGDNDYRRGIVADLLTEIGL